MEKCMVNCKTALSPAMLPGLLSLPRTASSWALHWSKPTLSLQNLKHFNFYSSSIARFLRPNPIDGKPESAQSWNLYAYVENNPVNRTDPKGLNWFLIDSKWEWHKGKIYKKGKGDKARTYKSNYTHLLVVKLVFVDKKGVSHYDVALYNQNNKKPVASGTAFSGGANGASAVPKGNYLILNRRDPSPTYVQSSDPARNPPPSYGIQDISRAPLPSDDPADPSYYDVWSAYGPTRARLNPMGQGMKDEYYYHGQQPTRGQFLNTTHGCLSYGQDDSVIQAIANTNVNVPVSIETPVEFPW